MFTIAKSFRFSAAHHLPQLPAGHKCHAVHGHNYTVTLVLAAAELDQYGFVVDYGQLATFKRQVDALDHCDLNERLAIVPTAEGLAAMLFYAARAIWPQVVSCRVAETDSTWAEYGE